MANNRNWRSRIILGLVMLIIASAVLTITCLFFGMISGEEIMPDTFARRQFYYWEIPLVHIQVWPITRKDTKHDFIAWLAKQKYIKKTTGTAWDLVAFSRNGVPVVEADAHILCSYLDSKTSDNRYFWQVWSKDHPKSAALLWPRVSTLARKGLYLGIPDLMEIAAGTQDAKLLKPQLDQRIVQEYAAYAKRRTAAEDYESAAEALSAALALDPQDPDLLKARAEAYDALDEGEKAAADRAILSKLGK